MEKRRANDADDGSEDPIDVVLGPGGILAEAFPGYEHRPQQLAMAHAVARALADQRALLVEAGTGTGKTLAYLVPAILSQKKIIVSTGTRHLQEQIHDKDIPLLRDTLGLPVEVAMLKGISNYLCRRRFSELGDARDPDLVQITKWAATTQTGDRAELALVPDESPAWKQVTTTPDARLGPRCPFFERCFVTQARRAAAKAQIVIVNHHLYFADLALRAAHAGAAVLPAGAPSGPALLLCEADDRVERRESEAEVGGAAPHHETAGNSVDRGKVFMIL